MLLKWPEKAIGAIQKLFEQLQDIDVYVEDHGLESLYLELLKCVKPDCVRITRVFALGPRNRVIDAAQHHNFVMRRALFLIDGDFEWVRGEPAPQVPGVYRLDAYCIENLLITQSAVRRILMECAEYDVDTAEANLQFHEWKSGMSSLIELFECWAVLNRIDPTHATVSQGVGCMLDGNRKVPVLDPSKVQARVKAAEEILAQHAHLTVANLKMQVRERVSKLPEAIDIVSGKDFLIPLIRFHVHSLSKEVPNNSQLRFRLALNAHRERFNGVAAALENASKGYNRH